MEDYTQDELMAAMLEVADDPEALERLAALAEGTSTAPPDTAPDADTAANTDENV